MDDEKKAIAGSIPKVRETADLITAEGIKEIELLKADRGVKEIKKSELIRDVALSTVAKIQDLWNKVGLEEKDEATLRKYANYFVKPLASIFDVARKANVDVYEMKYGKKIQHEGEVEKFDDFIQRRMQEVQRKTITVTPIKEEDAPRDK